jgi:uncharacterized protein (DUF427 family)
MALHQVDAHRAESAVRIELDGVVLAESATPVLLHETGRPTRYYFDRADVRWEHLEASDTRTFCPFKGTTTGYWSARVGDTVHPDVAWCYDDPKPKVRAIAGLIAFYNEKVDVIAG